MTGWELPSVEEGMTGWITAMRNMVAIVGALWDDLVMRIRVAVADINLEVTKTIGALEEANPLQS